MSSNSQIHVTVYRVRSEEAVSLDSVLGPGGTELLRETMTRLPEISRKLGEAGASRLDWEPVRNQADCYQTRVHGDAVVLRLCGSVAEIQRTGERRIYGSAAQPCLDPDLQKAVHRKVNQLLAVAITQKISEQLERYVRAQARQRVVQEVKMTVANQFTLRASAYFGAR